MNNWRSSTCDGGGNFFGDHDDRAIDIGSRYARQDGPIDDTKPLQAVNLATSIRDRKFIRPHAAGTRGVMFGICNQPEPIGKIGISGMQVGRIDRRTAIARPSRLRCHLKRSADASDHFHLKSRPALTENRPETAGTRAACRKMRHRPGS